MNKKIEHQRLLARIYNTIRGAHHICDSRELALKAARRDEDSNYWYEICAHGIANVYRLVNTSYSVLIVDDQFAAGSPANPFAPIHVISYMYHQGSLYQLVCHDRIC